MRERTTGIPRPDTRRGPADVGLRNGEKLGSDFHANQKGGTRDKDLMRYVGQGLGEGDPG